MIKSGKLRNSIHVSNKTSNSVTITANMPYAQAHNEGFKGAVTQNVKAHRRKLTHRNTYKKTKMNGGKTKKEKVSSGVTYVKAFSRVLNRFIKKSSFDRLSQLNTNAMDVKKIETQALTAVEEWQSEIDSYTMEQLLQKPSDDSWNIGQVYIHLWMSAKGFFFKNIQRIADNDPKVKLQGKKNLLGYLVFAVGALPSVKVKMPDSVAVQPHPPESHAQLHKRMNEVKELIKENAARLCSLNPHATIKHPFLGYLTATEWLRLCAIHFQHHKKQKRRIKKQLGL